MPTREQQQIAESVLEQTIDKFGLQGTIRMLECICHEKADHIQTNWQDSGLSAQWSKFAAVLDKAAMAVAKIDPLS